MPDEPDLAGMEARRARLYADLGLAGDLRRGALNAVRRKCGKPNCACARAGHAGHGPQYNLTKWVGGTTVTVHLRPGPELDKAGQKVVPLPPSPLADKLYGVLDGTGVPMTARETAGREGKTA